MNLLIEFLEYLEPSEGIIAQHIDVLPFVKNQFKKPTDLSENADNEDDAAKTFLLALAKRKYISLVNGYGDLDHICNKSWTNPKGDKRFQYWFDDISIKVVLTPEAQEYLNNERLKNILSETNKSIQLTNKSTVDTNDLVKTNIKVQIGMGIVTFLAIAVTALVAVATYQKDDPPNLILMRKSMQRQEQLLDSIRLLQKKRNTYLKIMAKKNLPKK